MVQQIDSQKDLLKAIAGLLQRHKIPYFVTGGFAVSVWGRTRTTLDIDLGVSFTKEAIPHLVKGLKQLSTATYIDQDRVAEALVERGEFNFIESNVGIKVDFWVVPQDTFHKKMFSRIRRVFVDRQGVAFISPEDLVLTKLLWWQESQLQRDLDDVVGVLAVQPKLDWRYLAQWAKKLKVFSKLKELRDRG